MFVRLLFIIILCTSCSYKLVNPQGYKITVLSNMTLLENKTTLYGKNQIIRFVFSCNNAHGLHPKVYLFGAAYVLARVPENREPLYVHANTAYLFYIKFRNPGEAVMMFIWENKEYNLEPFVINLRYYGD